MKRFISSATAGFAILVILAPSTPAVAAAPTVTSAGTTVLTTTGRTALTYTGYMNGESFQQDGLT